MVDHATIHSIMDAKRNMSSPNNSTSNIANANYVNGCNRNETMKLISLNISGQMFKISEGLAQKCPTSRFAHIHNDVGNFVHDIGAYFYDRDPALFTIVLNVLRYDALSIPSNVADEMVHKELEFWRMDVDPSSLPQLDETRKLDEEFDWLEGRIPPPSSYSSRWSVFQYNFWWFLMDPAGPYTKYRRAAVAYAMVGITLTVAYMVLFGLSTSAHYRYSDGEGSDSPSGNRSIGTNITLSPLDNPQMPRCSTKAACFLATDLDPFIADSLTILMVYFTLESLIKFSVCPRKRNYVKSVINWVDITVSIFALCSFIYQTVNEHAIEYRPSQALMLGVIVIQALQVLRIFRIFQYAVLIDGLAVMILTLKASLQELILLVTYLLMGMFVFATAVTFVEFTAPVGVGIPDCLYGYWWAFITMTTVGYGDYHPETTGGYIIGILCATTGIILTALPVAVIGSNFNLYWEHNKKRKRAQSKGIYRGSPDTLVKQRRGSSTIPQLRNVHVTPISI